MKSEKEIKEEINSLEYIYGEAKLIDAKEIIIQASGGIRALEWVLKE